MSRMVKFLIGLSAVILMTWLHHGPLGNGAKLIGAIEAQAKAAVAQSELPGIAVSLSRDPLARTATLSGQADEFQREGQGSLPGLNDLVRDVEGISGVRWADQAGGGAGLPLFAETLAFTLLGYLLGVGLGWLLFGRPKKQSYLS